MLYPAFYFEPKKVFIFLLDLLFDTRHSSQNSDTIAQKS